jgi:hypothetical protein
MAANRDSSSTPASAINKDLAGEPDSPEPESMDELGVFYTPENSAVDWQDMSQGPTEDEEGAAYANGVVPTILAEQTASVPEVLQSIIDAAVLAEMASVANAGIEETNGGKDPLDSPATSGTPADYYDLLGLSTSATTAEIVIAYRRRARDVADLSTSDPLYVSIKTVRTHSICVVERVLLIIFLICALALSLSLSLSLCPGLRHAVSNSIAPQVRRVHQARPLSGPWSCADCKSSPDHCRLPKACSL